MAHKPPAVPDGYVLHRVRDTWLVFDRERAERLVPLRLADRGVRRALFSRAPRRGRGAAPGLPLEGEPRLVLRRYRHGGLFGRLTQTLLLGPGRAFAELAVSVRAERAGAPVPHVLCLVAWPVAGPLWSALIGTREVTQALGLSEALLSCESPRARQTLARATGAGIARLHDAGVEHRDLQLRNVLVCDGPVPRIIVIDLDRARFHGAGGLDVLRRARNLGRLARSAVKLGLWGSALGRREAAAFLGAYTAGKRALRRELRRRATTERLKIRIHRLGYRLRRPSRAVSPPRPA
jgi:3-deoxy-D-manno-octulosonic acid kinase